MLGVSLRAIHSFEQGMNSSSITEIQARFDQAAAQWEANPGRVALAKGVVAAIRNAVPLRSDMEVMDFGAGTGLVTLGVLPYVARVTAADASPEMLRVLDGKRRELAIDNVQTLLCDIATTPLPQAAFDVIVSSMVLHHLADVPQVFKRLRSCLRPGGWIAVADLDTEDGSFHSDPTGVFHHGFDRADVVRWLEGAGFTSATAGEAYRMVRATPDAAPRTYPIFLAVARAG